MAFDWGLLAKPATPVADQPYVDHMGVVWQWNATAQTWSRPAYLEMRRTREQFIPSQYMGVTYDFPRKGTITREWDYILSKSFVELRNVTTGEIIARRAHMDYVEFDAWFRAVVPNNGMSFDASFTLVIYEIVDTRVQLTRWRAWNIFYSSLRGRQCYTGNRGYGRYAPAQGHCAGYSDNFHHWHGGGLGVAGLERRLMQHFYGLDPSPGPNSPKAVWTSRKENVHKMPATQNGPIMRFDLPGGQADRYAWNWGGSDWTSAPAGQWEVFTGSGLTTSNPCYLWREEFNSTTFQISTPSSRLKGLGALKYEGMLAYCIRNVEFPEYVAFLVKPLGVTAVAAAANILQEDGWQLMAVGKYRGRAGDNRYTNLHATGQVQVRGDRDGFRVRSLRDVHVSLGISTRNHERANSIDSTKYPDQIYFYFRHPVTGIRSEEFRNHIDLIRRRTGIPVGFAEGT